MGYTYDNRTNRLCCDKCGLAGGVCKRKCPCGWCPATALCPSCNKEVRVNGKWKEWHKNCKDSQGKMRRRDAERETLLKHGAFVRYSALNASCPGHPNRVHVLFEGIFSDDGTREIVGLYMDAATYAAFDALQVVTIKDYERVGRVELAPASSTTLRSLSW